MARIVKVAAGHQDVRPHTSEVECYVQTLTDPKGELLVHLSTFGSAQRQSEPKSSQTMQVDKEIAADLVAYFIAAFGKSVLPAEV